MNKLFPKGFPQKGEIYKFNFNPAKGKEIRDIHPGLVISNDIQNEYGHYLIVAPITSSIKEIRLFEVAISANQQTGLTKASKILLNQIRSLDKAGRVIAYLGVVEEEIMEKVRKGLNLVLDLEETSYEK